MKTFTEKDVEDFLLEKYDTKILIYKGFYFLRTIICEYNDVVNNMMSVYKNLAEKHNTTNTAVERALRHFRNRVDNSTSTNKELINMLILEFQRWL